MSKLADEATSAAVELRDRVRRLAEEVRTCKPLCVDPQARDMLTRLQADLILISTDAEQIKSLVGAARMTGYFEPPRPAYDRRMAAAHDLSLLPEEGGES